eukprot:m.163142 g.163142  ORF g.163142 m.163142 type:complete len:187 (-) comp18098_c0_seq2:926-1486(-)
MSAEHLRQCLCGHRLEQCHFVTRAALAASCGNLAGRTRGGRDNDVDTDDDDDVAPATTLASGNSDSRSTFFVNKIPTFDPKTKQYMMPFYGRVAKPSVKNFVLVQDGFDLQTGKAVLLHGRREQHYFRLVACRCVMSEMREHGTLYCSPIAELDAPGWCRTGSPSRQVHLADCVPLCVVVVFAGAR